MAARTQGFEFVRSVAGIREYRLIANDLRVLYLQHGVLPVATFMVTYGVGSRNESAGLTGATHFLEHLMFKGTEKYNKASGTSVFEVLQRVGAQVNATTWFDRTNYYEQLPTDHFDLAASIEADRMRGALIRPEDVESERTVILNEFDRGENEPTRKLYHEVWSTAFSAHPYGHPTIGWRSDIEQVTPEDLRGFYDRYYYPDNATVSVIGGIDERAALETVRRHFESVEKSPLPIPEVRTAEPEQRGERRTEVRMSGEVGSVMVAFKVGHRREAESITLDVVASILADGKNSRLYRRLVDAGLASSVGASCAALRDPGLFYVYASLVPGVSHEQVEGVIWDEIERLAAEPPAAAEMKRARTMLLAECAFARDGSFLIASQLNEAIASGDWTLYPEFMRRVRRVTRDDVSAVMSASVDRSRRTVGYYVPTRNGARHG